MKKRLKIVGIVIGGLFLLIILVGIFSPAGKKSFQEGNQKANEAVNGTPSPTQQTLKETVTPTVDGQRELKILQEQKAKAETLDKTAVNLITQNKIADAIALYKARWDELAKLRVDIIYDKELTDAQKKNIDSALKVDQEGVTSIISKYEQLYP